MFVTEKKLKFLNEKLNSENFTDISIIFDWDENTKKLIKTEKNYQDEIDQYKSLTLREMLNKNIIPESNRKPVYADISSLQNKTLSDLDNAINIINNETEKHYKKMKKENEKDIKNNNQVNSENINEKENLENGDIKNEI